MPITFCEQELMNLDSIIIEIDITGIQQTSQSMTKQAQIILENTIKILKNYFKDGVLKELAELQDLSPLQP